MNLHFARHLAISLMKQHGLAGWSFRFDHARRRFGACFTTRKEITLSRPLTFLNSEEQVRDTILHEIAHALTPGDGHGQRWRAMCRNIGAKPERCYGEEHVVTPPRREPAFQIGCTRCNWWVDRRRRNRQKMVCKKCRTAIVYREKMIVAKVGN